MPSGGLSVILKGMFDSTGRPGPRLTHPRGFGSGAHFVGLAAMTALVLGASCGGNPQGMPAGSTGPGTTGGEHEAGETGGMNPAGANTPGPSASAPTWHGQVAALVAARCAGCHRAGGIAPFSLTSYETAKPFAGAMAAAVTSERMPPWLARETDDCQPRFGWKDDLRLPEEDKALLRAWAENGAPEGDPATAKGAPQPVSLDLANPTRRVAMGKPFTVQGTADVFRCFPLPYVFEQDVWIDGLQVVPGNAKVVHHVLVWLDSDGQSEARAGANGSYPCFGAPGFDSTLLGAWAPGGPASELPPDTGLYVPRGSRIVINVHYHPAKTAETDTTALDLRWSTTRPRYEALLALPGNARNIGEGLLPGPNDPASGPAFLIPAGARGHEENAEIAIQDRIPIPVRIFAVGTHMHYVGTGMRMLIDRTSRVGGPPADEPARECLIETPRWDFHWQRGYLYDAPLETLPTVKNGDRLALRCLYDNSLDNPHVADALREQGLKAPRDVELGEQTLDEMCLGVLGIAYPSLGRR